MHQFNIHSMLCGQEIMKSLISQSTGMYTANLHKSIDMLNKNTPGVKKGRSI